MNVTIYTDGAARGNPGPGGYGAVLRYTAPSGKVHVLELSRGYERTTNNRMELMAVIAALEVLNRPCTAGSDDRARGHASIVAFSRGYRYLAGVLE